jgi:glycine/D-amino acid oxidase-like deaminating enzyme
MAYFASISSHTRTPYYTSSPEAFNRTVSGTAYVAGENGGVPLPKFARDVSSLKRKDYFDKLKAAAGLLSSSLDPDRGCKVVKEQLCFRPITADMAAIIDKLSDNVWICAGHGPWVRARLKFSVVIDLTGSGLLREYH